MYDLDILKSGLQKYIRRNIPDKALFCLRDLLFYAEKARRMTIWKSILYRLVIISVEDISIGDVITVVHVLKTISTIKTDVFPGFQTAWNRLAPLVVMMCTAEKTREFAHIYYGLYIKDITPEISFEECLMNKDIRLIQWLRLSPDKISCLDALEKYCNNSNLRELYRISRSLIANIKENIWIFGLLFLMYLHNIDSYEEKSSIKVDLDLSEWIVDDFVVDKHTKLGRSNGKTLKDFVHEGSVLSPISKYTTQEYKELHDQLYG
ncbi:Hypothetical protein HVR_LOCUS851 [uncultured virus]|nr:Hypothetical protein HVR_LOCUS851 [uncultured virus]